MFEGKLKCECIECEKYGDSAGTHYLIDESNLIYDFCCKICGCTKSIAHDDSGGLSGYAFVCANCGRYVAYYDDKIELACERLFYSESLNEFVEADFAFDLISVSTEVRSDVCIPMFEFTSVEQLVNKSLAMVNFI